MDYLGTYNFHVLFYDALKLLGFERYLRSNKCYRDLEFSSSTFQKANQKAFEVVTYFLFDQLKGSEFTKPFRGCYPCLDKTHESDFRKNVISSFKKLEKDPNFNYKFLPGIVCSPGGDSFVSLYLALINYILKKTLNVEKLHETSIEDLQSFIECERESLMSNCHKQKEKALKDEEYCGYFSDKLNSLRDDESKLKERMSEVDQELLARFGTVNTGELMCQVKTNFDKIKSHKLRSLYEENKQILSTESADIENRIVNLRSFISDPSLIPVDLAEVKRSFESKLSKLKQNVDTDTSNIEDAIEKLDIKAVCYTSTNRILTDLTNELEKKIDLLRQETETKKRAYLQRADVQDLIKYVKSKVNFNPPVLEFKAEKNESRGKQSLPDANFTVMDQTLANRSMDEEINLSINLAEMTCDYTPDNDESYMFSNQTLCRGRISHMPNLDNIRE